jgi:hypothetical protein
MNNWKKLMCGILCLSFATLEAESDDLEALFDDDDDQPTKVIAAFKSTHLINAETNETVKKKTLDFRITHRFGNIAGESGGAHTLWGIDNATNIRFSFDYGITDNLTVGLGRSKVNEHLDGSIKYKLMEQMKGGFPLSVVVFANIGLIPRANINNLYPNFSSRLSYSYQAIFTKKLNWRTSIGILPTYIHRNRVSNDVNASNGARDQNDLFSVGAIGRFKITQSFGIIAEYFYTFSKFRQHNELLPYYMPLGVGIEIETGGHVFQVNFTNSAGIIYNDFIPTTRESWDSGSFKLGFTISRVFGG